MGKEKPGFLTAKAISNRIKAKGLQKLRWYCQMCQKQCRDENGFKLHTTSESHHRQLLLVAENPNKFVDSFSQEFHDAFINLLSRRYGTTRVKCNVVYQEYISDKNHLHMNSTRWTSLTQYVQWLGRHSFCTVDETEKGWFIQYIDRRPETIARQNKLKDMDKANMMEAEMEEKRIKRMIERGAMEYVKLKKEEADPKSNELIRNNTDEKIVFKMLTLPGAQSTSSVTTTNTLIEAEYKQRQANLNKLETTSTSSLESSTNGKRKLSVLEEIKEAEVRKKARFEKNGSWISEGIVVKIVSNIVGVEYCNKKAVIKEVKSKQEVIASLIDTGRTIKLNQSDLRTVLPAIGKQVLILKGPHKGEKATLKSLQEQNYCCTICLDSGPSKGKTLNKMDYEDICKIY